MGSQAEMTRMQDELLKDSFTLDTRVVRSDDPNERWAQSTIFHTFIRELTNG